MNLAKSFLGIIFTIYLLILLYEYKKSKKLFKMIIIITLQGIASLFAINLIGNFIKVHIPVNYYTLTFSSLFGFSGVMMLLLFEVFLS